jgi:hypothetical protein
MTGQLSDEVLIQELIKAIQSIRFGSVEVTVHDGRVTQIEKREKVRLNSQPVTNNK